MNMNAECCGAFDSDVCGCFVFQTAKEIKTQTVLADSGKGDGGIRSLLALERYKKSLGLKKVSDEDPDDILLFRKTLPLENERGMVS